MNSHLLHNQVQQYLRENESELASTIALKKSPFEGVDSKELAQQIQGLKKAKNKLPTWYNCNAVIYPPVLNLEQTSSEKTANYKSQLVKGNTLLDATGGFGIDSFYFSKQIKSVIHCELNKDLQKIATHNFTKLKAYNIESLNTNGIQQALKYKKLDWLYIDPSRRSNTKGKVFFLKDCEPNILEIQDDCFKVANNILIKTAPILDISVGISEIKNVKEIHIVALNNEVKELLWLCEKEFRGDPLVVASSINKNLNNRCQFLLSEIENVIPRLSLPQKYLYEPFSAVMKTGAFNWVSQKFKVSKLHINSHLYTSENLIDFPGRKFKINSVYPYNKKIMKSLMNIKTNVVSRNFKENVAQLRKKYKLKEGLKQYLFFTTDVKNSQIVINCTKIDE